MLWPNTLSFHSYIDPVNFNYRVSDSWDDDHTSFAFDSCEEKTGTFLNKETIVHGPRFKSIFSGVGRFPIEPVNIQLSDDAVLIQNPARYVPMSLIDKFEQEIHSMEKSRYHWSFIEKTSVKQSMKYKVCSNFQMYLICLTDVPPVEASSGQEQYYIRSAWHVEECNWEGSRQSDVPPIEASSGQEQCYIRSALQLLFCCSDVGEVSYTLECRRYKFLKI